MLRSLYVSPVWHQLDGGFGGWGIICQPGCLYHSWGVRQPRDPELFPTVPVLAALGALPGWQHFHRHCRVLLLQ